MPPGKVNLVGLFIHLAHRLNRHTFMLPITDKGNKNVLVIIDYYILRRVDIFNAPQQIIREKRNIV